MPLAMTIDALVGLQEELIAAYEKPDFQAELRAAVNAAGKDPDLRRAARTEMLLKVQGPIIQEYGFPPTPEGVFQSMAAFTPEINKDPIIKENTSKIMVLADPDIQAKVQKFERDKAVEEFMKAAEGDDRVGPTTMSKRDLLAMQADFIEAYSQVSVQMQLRAVVKKHGGNSASADQERKAVLFEAQKPVLERWGFPPTPLGLFQSGAVFTAEMNADADIAAGNRQLFQLTDPALQDRKAGDKPAAGTTVAPDVPAAVAGGRKRWKVTGGGDKGGIVVRSGRDPKTTKEYPERLQHGAVVEEMGISGERLWYRRIAGTGPEEGWVSLMFKGNPLLQPYKG